MSLTVREQYLKDWEHYPGFKMGVGVRLERFNDSEMVLACEGRTVRVVGEGSVEVHVRNGQAWSTLALDDLKHLFRPGDWLIVGACPGSDSVTVGELGFLMLAAPNLKTRWITAKPLSAQFSRFVEDVRCWFLKAGFEAANTPSLVPCPGMEPPLNPFQIKRQKGRLTFLPTSPELHLKKLLCRGYTNLFEIKRVYRQEMITPHHQPEFLMLEWYRSFSDLKGIREDLKSLLDFLDVRGWNQAGLNLSQWHHLTIAGLFQQYMGFELKPETPHSELLELARRYDVGFQCDDDSWDDTYFKIFLTKLEEKLQSLQLATLSDYPPSQAALARLNPAGWAERMEFYISGLEVGNAFDELNDPELQRQRFESDQRERRQRGLVDVPLDEEFLDHLQMGLPPTAGIAVGLERLFMGVMGVSNISEILEFPEVNQED